MSHTKEPWHVAPGGDYCDIVCQDHVDIARTDIEEDARRIVVCVNACAGIATEKLEGIKGNSLLQTAARVMNIELIQQRDELLAALERAEKAMEICSDWMTEIEMPDGWTTTTDEKIKISEAIANAIATAKGGAA